jgi:hypothetical protein
MPPYWHYMDLLLQENKILSKMHKFDVKMHCPFVFHGVYTVICLILPRLF